MAMEVTQILLNAQSSDGAVRNLAEDSLKQFQEQNFAVFLFSLANELANNDKPSESRRLAGLILKNSLDAKEVARKAEFVQRWVSLDAMVKLQIKAALLATLGSPVPEAYHSAAQVIAKVASIELPRGEWPELVQTLLQNMGAPGNEQPAHLKQATLESLGYVCEEVLANVLAQDQVNSILTAVVQGMNASETTGVRLAATKALYNALDFAQTNFENEMERSYIMQVVCEATQSPDKFVRLAAFECLVSIASTYYEKLAPYMEDIFHITSKATREDEEPVALQAIELWSSICDEEIEIQEDFAGDSEITNYHFIKQALPALVPMLLETLSKQEEDQDVDEDVWNLSMAGGICLGLVARTVGDDIVDIVMPYVKDNITKQDWHFREAATYAFGSILEGPTLEKLTPLVNSALVFLQRAMKDTNNHVKDTTAWTIGRICEFLHGPTIEAPVITASNLPSLLQVLLESLRDTPNVADKVCGALYFLAQGYEDSGMSPSPLSPFFQAIVEALLATADREDAGETRLRASAYEALNEVVRSSTEDTDAIVVQLIPVIMDKLLKTLEMQIVSTDEREKQTELQALLCGSLQVIIQKLSGTESNKYSVQQYADQMMALFLRVFACRSATVHEEAMLAIGALAYAVGKEFGKYMPEFYKYLEMGLQNFEEYQVCSVTVGVVGDICRALDEKVLPYCDRIMSQLLTDLSSNQLHRSVKPPIFSCFGDIALAISESFEKYLLYAVPMLQKAAEMSAQQQARGDEELIDYNNQLRRGIFEAYSGIFQGFKGKKPEVLAPYAEHIICFIENVFQDKERDEIVTKAAIGVLGDLADTLGPSVGPLFGQHPFYREYVEECLHSEDNQLTETAEWVKGRIAVVVGGASS
ncbi:hypothetical protein CBR_g21240 [Chara braunii]|uniref:Importin N-terminal domain-containing protein n=1 Tax=Chara braunii TaxID=69332 RepID=A0A388L125_CHABU|nr:hypothetical protein CBR_g21240 [Chara braunii]|eukprot:GBG75999.1 hypothetical protein CBR_g21240 [Chara braunii]